MMKNFLSFCFDLIYVTAFYSFLSLGLVFFLSYCIIGAFLYLPLFGFIVGFLSLYITFHVYEIGTDDFLKNI